MIKCFVATQELSNSLQKIAIDLRIIHFISFGQRCVQELFEDARTKSINIIEIQQSENASNCSDWTNIVYFAFWEK